MLINYCLSVIGAVQVTLNVKKKRLGRKQILFTYHSTGGETIL